MTTTASPTRACSDPTALRWAAFKTAWGWVAAVRSRAGVTRLSMPQRTKALARRMLSTQRMKHDPDAFADVVSQLQAYFRGEAVDFTVEVDLSALPPFYAATLAAARHIPYGQTVTYGELARRLRKPGPARAVGQAMAHNPVPIIVPCHRVVASTGLGGFSAAEGLDLKRRLLELEARG